MDSASYSDPADPSFIYISRRELYDIIKSSNKMTMEEKLEYLKEVISERTNCPENKLPDLFHTLSIFFSKFKNKWVEVYRSEDRFLKKNSMWLEGSEKLNNYVNLPVVKNVGRPAQAFLECAERTKRKKTEELRASRRVEELAYATQMSMRLTGQTDASVIIKEITSTTPTRPQKYRLGIRHLQEKSLQQMSGEEALALLIDAKLTRHQYCLIRNKDKTRFPSYKVVQETKKLCYPNDECISINETTAEVTVQALLDHTISRLLQAQKDVFLSLNLKGTSKVKCMLTSKWGIDGTSGNSEYKQKLSEGQEGDSSVLMSAVVPLKLIMCEDNGNEKNIWQNPRTSSTRYCRPLKFKFVREDVGEVKIWKASVDEQVKQLLPSSICQEDINIEVHHKLLFTMIDGKVCNYLTDNTSTQKCYLCGLGSKDFNNIELVNGTLVDARKFEFGLSILHGWIRFFECLLHISYKIPIAKWQARSEEEKETVKHTKIKIQKRFREETGLIIDKPKPGFGSSNDGNTARRFFENYKISSKVTGVNEDLICRFGVILQTISSGYNVNIDKFSHFTQETAEMFVRLYGWYPMPPTVHKILIHGPDIISYHDLLPIGQLSEEAQEARNKDFKQARRHFSRKTSRVDTNTDIFHSLLISSDPIISNLRPLPRRKLKTFSHDVLQFLETPKISISKCEAHTEGILLTEDSNSDEDSIYSTEE